MTMTEAATVPSVSREGTPSWTRTAGTLIVGGGVLLTIATAVEIATDVAGKPGPAAAFWTLLLASTIAHVTAMFPMALGRGDGRGAVGASAVGAVALLGFGAFFLANQSLYVFAAYLTPVAEPTVGVTIFLFSMSAVQGVLLLVGGTAIVRAGILRGAARWAILALALIGIALGVVINVSTLPALTNAMYFVSTGAQVIAGVVIARARVVAAK